MVNKEMNICILGPPKNAVRSKRLEKWRTNSWYHFHDNAPAHWSVLAKDILAKINVITLMHPPYSPNMAATDFYLFP
jgi:hypothetical protein